MIQDGSAYRCFLQKDELDQLRDQAEKKKEIFRVPQTYRDFSLEQQEELINQGKSFTIRLKVPAGETVFTDLVYGTIKIQNKDLDDFIIARSDGSPTYNFVVAVDDSDMTISHVIRGDDHLANTPKQILVYKALGFDVPIFAHLPMILGSDKKRLSKRHAATNVQEYKDKGFMSKAILNYLSLLGWNPDSDKEIFEIKELISEFKFDQVQKKSAVFDEKKLLWVSSQHLASMSVKDVMKEIALLDNNWGKDFEKSFLIDVISLIKDRSKTTAEILEMSKIFLEENITIDQDLIAKSIDNNALEIISDFKSALETQEQWNREAIETIFDNLMTQHEVGIGKVMKPVRIAVSGIPFGPGIFDLIVLLGKNKCLARIENILKSA
jgi:glutamyl-tRNA synthetase